MERLTANAVGLFSFSTKEVKGMPKLAIGTRVRMSVHGERQYVDSLNNPFHIEGVIVEYQEPVTAHVYRVCWDNGRSNVYREGEIQEIERVTKRPKKGFGKWVSNNA